MALLMNLTTILTAINIILIIILLYVYIKNFKKIKSMFTFGLLIFAILFLIQNIISFYFFVTMTPYFVNMVEIYVFLFSLIQTLAFVILNWITLK